MLVQLNAGYKLSPQQESKIKELLKKFKPAGYESGGGYSVDNIGGGKIEVSYEATEAKQGMGHMAGHTVEIDQNGNFKEL